MTKALRLIVVVVILAVAGVLGLIFMSTAVVREVPERNIFIPAELTMDLLVKAAYNGEEIFFRFEWDAPRGYIYHDYFRYQDGRWTRYGESTVGPQPEGIYEDRLTFFVDDGSVDGFAQYGGFITAVRGMRFLTGAAASQEVRQHPYLGEERGRTDVRKYLPETRTDPSDWATVRPTEELQALHGAGYFLDLWHWRAHRSNPIGYVDDQYVFDFRWTDPGRSIFTTNWDAQNERPRFMFDVQKTGQYAMRWEKVLNREYSQQDYYYLSEDIAVPFDPEHPWQEGDVIPRQLLRAPTGGVGDIFANGVWDEGRWHLDLRRRLDTGDPRGDKTLRHGGRYHLAFAVHRNATGSRWHYVSFPFTLGLGQDADIAAVRFEGSQPPWSSAEWVEVPLFYPGQMTWDRVVGRGHAGAQKVEQRIPLRAGHSERQLAFYAVESEFQDEIRSQWLVTMLCVLLLIAAGAYALVTIARKEER